MTTACVAQASRLLAQSSSLIIRHTDAQQNNPSYLGRELSPTDQLNNSNEQLHALSLFTIPIPEPRHWQEQDLVHVIVRETSEIKSKAEKTSAKDYQTSGQIDALPYDLLDDFVRNQLRLTNAALKTNREFNGEGEYKRDDDFTARITARIIQVLPNGHLTIEARTHIQTDEEVATMVLSGICDPEDVSPAGTILSSDIFDLRLVKEHEGELRNSTEKGLFAKIIDAIFAF